MSSKQKQKLLILSWLILSNFHAILAVPALFSTIPNPPNPKAPIKWSILIATLETRRASFTHIFEQLQAQIKAANLADQIEILVYRDDRELPVGAKRNILLARAQGEYSCFIDDDDLVSPNYITLIYPNLLQNPDCVTIEGIMTFCGGRPTKFIHATKYKTYVNNPDLLLRPPTHLDIIKTTISQQFKFPDHKNWQEDREWALQLSAAGVLQTEIHLNSEPLYFYQFDPYLSETFNQHDFTAANQARLIQKNLVTNSKVEQPPCA